MEAAEATVVAEVDRTEEAAVGTFLHLSCGYPCVP